MTPIATAPAEWLDAPAMAFTETPARRRMVRPLRQHVDLKFVRASEAETPAIDPTLYDCAGQAAGPVALPGRLLNVRA